MLLKMRTNANGFGIHYNMYYTWHWLLLKLCQISLDQKCECYDFVFGSISRVNMHFFNSKKQKPKNIVKYGRIVFVKL